MRKTKSHGRRLTKFTSVFLYRFSVVVAGLSALRFVGGAARHAYGLISFKVVAFLKKEDAGLCPSLATCVF